MEVFNSILTPWWKQDVENSKKVHRRSVKNVLSQVHRGLRFLDALPMSIELLVSENKLWVILNSVFFSSKFQFYLQFLLKLHFFIWLFLFTFPNRIILCWNNYHGNWTGQWSLLPDLCLPQSQPQTSLLLHHFSKIPSFFFHFVKYLTISLWKLINKYYF